MSSKTTSNNKKLIKACVESLAKSEPVQQNGASPAPASREDCLRKAAEKGQLDVSPLDLSKSLLGKRKAESEENGPKAKIIVISLFDPKDKTEYAVAAMLSGDLYPLRESIKKAPVEECVINGETIPMVADCLKAKYISTDFMMTLLRTIPTECSDFGKYLAANVKQAWMLYAPYRGGDKVHGVAAVDVGIQMYDYAKALQRALTGQPLHYEEVEVVNYFVGIDELRAIDNMYTTPDPHYGQRRSIIRR